jgi:hypothetical protein
MVDTKEFNHILLARFSPANGCHVEEGGVLIVEARAKPPKRPGSHFFIGASLPRIRSRYGWVAVAPAFDLDAFARAHLHDRTLTEWEKLNLTRMFEAIAKLKPGTPVAADYFERGMGRSATIDLVVHRVILRGE